MTPAARFLSGLAVLLACMATEVRADQVVVVLDRGQAARAEAAAHERVALALLSAHTDDAVKPRLILYGTRPDGRPRSGVLTRGFAKTLDRSREKEGWSYDGPTDPRKALDLARGRAGEDERLVAYLVGPFAGEAIEEDEGTSFLEAWEEAASDDRRVVPVFAGAEAERRLAGASGLLDRGWILLGHGESEIETLPFAPLDDDARLEARLFLPLDLVAIGRADGILPLDVTTDRADDLLDVDARPDGLHVHLRRDDLAAIEGTVTFALPSRPDVIVLTDTPAEQALRWDERIAGARLERRGDDGGSPVFEALDVVGEAAPFELALLVADASEPVSWTISDQGTPPTPGLRVEARDEATERPHVRRHVFALTFAYTGVPVDREGELLLRAEGHATSFRIPYHVRTAPARIHVRREGAGEAAALPLAEDDPGFTWLIERLGGNAPQRVRLRAEIADEDLAQRLILRTRIGEQESPVRHLDLLEIDGASLPVRVDIRPKLVAGTRPRDGQIRFALLQEDGVVGQSDGAGFLQARRPRLVLEGGDEAAYVLQDGVLESTRPLVVRVDPDGGPASWRAALFEVRPALVVPPASPTAWRLETVEPGRWAIQPDGPWRGARASTFDPRREQVSLEVTWPRGEAPGPVPVSLLVKPRWGTAGWILVGLAAIALVIGGIALSHLRSPPVIGTLLYAVEGKEGAVGRLDLAAVGRGSKTLTVDDAGRLEFGGAGRRLGRVRASRVGGLLDLEAEQGERSRHLLVDGLAFETNTHRLRYVSTNPDDSRVAFTPEPVPDLLGPEFDLAGGRIRALDAPPHGPEGPSPAEEEAEGLDARS